MTTPLSTPATAPLARRPTIGRDGFLDTVRAIALVRVVLWHASGVAALTYVVAAIPAMFFVTGSLLAQSAARRSITVVLRDRVRRMLLPFWLFAAAAWIVMAVAARVTESQLHATRAVTWIVPLTDPRGSDWEAGWLTSHLWYLRAMLWVLALSPLLLIAYRRRPVTLMAGLFVTVFVLDVVERQPSPLLPRALTWPAGDVALYGLFFLVGFVHRDGVLDGMRRANWIWVTLGFAVAAGLWRATQPVPLGVVNNSHPMHLFVGGLWLSVAFAMRPRLSWLASSPRTGALVRMLSRRSLTIYLWHTSAILAAYSILDHTRLPSKPAAAVIAAIIVVGCAIAIAAFGWTEDVAARRSPSLWPGSGSIVRSPLTSLAIVSVAVVVTLAWNGEPYRDAQATPRRPPVPSAQPPKPIFGDHATAATLDEPVDDAFLDSLIPRWREQHGVPGVVAGVLTPDGHTWIGAAGHWAFDGLRTTVDDQFDLMSATKLLTANLVYRAADDGVLDLDSPIGAIIDPTIFPYGDVMTPRILLSHRSGLTNYRDTAAYADDPSIVSSPLDAIRVSAAEPLHFEPGTRSEYSSTNYSVLGLVLEQTIGRAFDDLVREMFIGPLGLHQTSIRPPGPGEPNHATAGVETTIADVLRIGEWILRQRGGLSDNTFNAMTDIDRESGLGAGTVGYCPCTIDNDVPNYYAVGHTGGTVFIVIVPSTDAVVAVNVTDSLWTDGRFGAVEDLVRLLAQYKK